MRVLLDTCVISETLRPKGAQRVKDRVRGLTSRDTFDARRACPRHRATRPEPSQGHTGEARPRDGAARRPDRRRRRRNSADLGRSQGAGGQDHPTDRHADRRDRSASRFPRDDAEREGLRGHGRPSHQPLGGRMSEQDRRAHLPARQGERRLSAAQFQHLSDVPAAAVWLANIDNPNTRRAYQGDVEAFVSFCGVETPAELRLVTRAHLLAWRGVLEADGLAAATIRRKLSAVSSLFDHLCNENAVESNPVAGVKRPGDGANEGKTPALSDEQARKLLQAPRGDSLKAVRDRAILGTYLFHALRRSELAGLRVESMAERRASCI
ncbi:Tyrosine recombinase XerC (plasmid) [Planctomycetes bacterium Pla86]|nr:Tyrosine recombinase XerC [Planctomycetes bacterium Pla86]